MSKNIPVRFLKAWRTYFTGDVAGFSKDLADELVDGGVAEYASEAVARKNSRRPQAPAPAPTPPAATQEPTQPAGEAGEAGEGGNDADDEEKP